MEQPLYDKLLADNQAIEMIRPFWNYKPEVNPKDLTVLICQGNKRNLTELCISSLLRFYPDIQILVVNGSPNDFDSTMYLKYMALKHENVKIWKWDKVNSHGIMMNTAIRQEVTTEFILLMDNDIITERGGYIEGMLRQLYRNTNMFATGTLMIVTRSNHSCGVPVDEADVLRHAHPSCSMIKRSMYLTLRPAADHGAPLCYTMDDAEKKGFEIGSYPVDKFVSHLSGASWTDPCTIWNNDHDVCTRPFVTFIISTPVHFELLSSQTDRDFDMIIVGEYTTANVVIHGSESVAVDNMLYDLRFRVKGEYVCVLPDNIGIVNSNYMEELRKEIVNQKIPDRISIGGLISVKRELWQEKDCLL